MRQFLSKLAQKIVLYLPTFFVAFQLLGLPSFVHAVPASELPVDFSQVTVNAEKQAQFTKDIRSLYADIPIKMPGLQYDGLDKVVIASPEFIASNSGFEPDEGYQVDGYYEPDNRIFYVNSDLYQNSTRIRSTLAHEMLHSYTRPGTGYEDEYLGEDGPEFEEMLVEHYSTTYYGGDRENSGYAHLLAVVDEIYGVVAATGQRNPDTVLINSLFNVGFKSLGQQIDSYLDKPGFFQKLGSYLDKSPSKSNVAGATQYLNSVKQQITAKRKTLAQVPVRTEVLLTNSSQVNTLLTDITEFVIDPNDGNATYTVYVALSEAPTSPVTLDVTTRGALPLTVSSKSLTFDKSNFSAKQSFTFTHPGTGSLGDRAELIFKNDYVQTKIVKVTAQSSPLLSTGTVLSPTTTAGSNTTGINIPVGPSTPTGSGSPTTPPTGSTLNNPTSKGFTLGLPFSDETHYDDFNSYFAALVDFAIQIAVLVAVLVIIYAGFMYSQSQGQADKVSTAKELIAGSLTGLALLLLIRLIVPTLGINVQ